MSILKTTKSVEKKPQRKCSFLIPVSESSAVQALDLQVPISQTGEINVAVELQAVWKRIEVDREHREMEHELLEVLLKEIHTQKNLLHAQTMASSAMAEALDKQMLEIRQSIHSELIRCCEKYDQLKSETRWNRIEVDQQCEMWQKQFEVLLNEVHTQKTSLHAQTMATSAVAEAFDEKILELRADVFSEVTRCSMQCDKVQNETTRSRMDRDRELEGLLNELHSQKNFLHAQTMASSAMGEAFDRQMFGLRKNVGAELTRCHTDIEQLKAMKADKFEIANVADRCEKGVAFMALELKEQADLLLSTIEDLRFEKLRPQWTFSGELKARGGLSPTRTNETEISEAWCPSNSDDSWNDEEPSFGNDNTSEQEVEG